MGPLEHGDPERIGRYRLIGRLGAGGMGQVYFGRSMGGRAVAIKRIHPHMATDTSFRERFAREVTAARQVSGAFTAPVIDADTEGEVPWLVTSYVPSLPLDEGVGAHGALPEHSLRVLAVGLAEALNEIHRAGLIHRDLKPGNVLLAEDGPRVIDFGIARATEGTAATQSVIGTPGFMSPEQVQGERMTPVSDMFAFGAVLVYAASGSGPFGEGAMPTMVMRILQNEPDISAVPPSLQRLVAACLVKDPRGRPGPGDILDALGDVPIDGSWLPPAFMRGIQEQVDKVNTALSDAPDSDTAGSAERTSALGAAAAGAAGGAVAGAAAGYMLGDHDSTQAAQQGGAGSTRAMDSHDGQTASFANSQGAQHQPTTAYGQSSPTAAMPAGQDPYADLYRDPRQEQQRQTREQAEQRRQQEREREEQRRRQEEERAHQDRVRAEQRAARQAQTQARKAAQPSLWSFVKLIPLLIIPILQIPLGYGASYAWEWFTATEMWGGVIWEFPEPFTEGAFFHALFLGYFLLNNVLGLEYLVRSLRTGFVAGAVMAGAVIVATNGILFSYGFFG